MDKAVESTDVIGKIIASAYIGEDRVEIKFTDGSVIEFWITSPYGEPSYLDNNFNCMNS